MTTITQQLADALRTIVADKGSAAFNDDLEAYDAAVQVAREALAAYEAQQAPADFGEHSAEPWEFGSFYASSNLTVNFIHAGKEVFEVRSNADLPIGRNDANAIRIIACVNACAGMPTDEIKRYGIGELAECARNWTRDNNED